MKIITNLNGGLGNQMFQYAFARALAAHFNCPIALNTQGLSAHAVKRDYSLGIFNLDETTHIDESNPGYNNIFIRDYRPVFNKDYITSTIQALEKLLENNQADKNIVIEGYFQDPKLFSAIVDRLKEDFKLKKTEYNSREYKAFEKQSTLVVLQVRRGDFIGNAFHQVCTLNYYNDAIKLAVEKFVDPIFVIVSEDPKWCIDNLDLKGLNYTIKNNSTIAEDYTRMYKCKNFIISNSSFGWWPAYLYGEFVICPNKWYNSGESALILPERNSLKV